MEGEGEEGEGERDIICNTHIHIYTIHAYMQVSIEDIGSPDAGVVTGSHESPEVGAENQTRVLCKNGKCS